MALYTEPQIKKIISSSTTLAELFNIQHHILENHLEYSLQHNECNPFFFENVAKNIEDKIGEIMPFQV
jgi:hypothetical protein